MQFAVLKPNAKPPKKAHDRAFLIADEWTDRGKYKTLFHLVLFDADGVAHGIGDVKIGEFAMAEGQERPSLDGSFDKLDKRFFSLGQDDTYYERLNALGSRLRKAILASLRDVASDRV